MLLLKPQRQRHKHAIVHQTLDATLKVLGINPSLVWVVPFVILPEISLVLKNRLHHSNHIRIWWLLPLPICGAACQIWMQFQQVFRGLMILKNWKITEWWILALALAVVWADFSTPMWIFVLFETVFHCFLYCLYIYLFTYNLSSSILLTTWVQTNIKVSLHTHNTHKAWQEAHISTSIQ